MVNALNAPTSFGDSPNNADNPSIALLKSQWVCANAWCNLEFASAKYASKLRHNFFVMQTDPGLLFLSRQQINQNNRISEA